MIKHAKICEEYSDYSKLVEIFVRIPHRDNVKLTLFFIDEFDIQMKEAKECISEASKWLDDPDSVDVLQLRFTADDLNNLSRQMCVDYYGYIIEAVSDIMYSIWYTGNYYHWSASAIILMANGKNKTH